MTAPRILLLTLLFALAGGCSSLPFFGDDASDPESDETPENVVYEQALRALRSGNHEEAIKRLKILETRFPFGRYAEQAQLELIYAHHMNLDPEAARAAADRFIRLHPNHAAVDYAYYVKGLAAFMKDRTFFERFLPADTSKRDPGAARDSFADFNQLVTRFPDSPYAHDARQRMIHLRNFIAASEVDVARFYLRAGAFVAAANRGRTVIEQYPQAPATPDALAVMVEAYSRLDQPELANDALRVLALNYPRYPAFDANGDFVLSYDVRNQDRSWLNLVTIGLLDRPQPPPPLRVRNPAGATDAGGPAAPRPTAP
jgi:outer membrane protein assembly factor BamD